MNYYAELFTDIEEKELFSSTDTVTKDKVLTVRVEPGFYSLLEALSEKMNTGSVGKTVRAILSMFLLPEVYRFEFENMKPERASGSEVNFERLHYFIQELEKYFAFLSEAQEKSETSMEFMTKERTKVEAFISELQETFENWNNSIMEKEKK